MWAGHIHSHTFTIGFYQCPRDGCGYETFAEGVSPECPTHRVKLVPIPGQTRQRLGNW
jgi:hypothetical protein